MDLEKKVEFFLKQKGPFTRPLLLGFSGGGDSLALAYCLKRLNISFHLAHFNHRWRIESDTEALQLKAWADSMDIPFHLGESSLKKATELNGRIERHAFFSDLINRDNFSALLLAHHQQDQLETILKRILEGSNLFHLKGIRSFHQIREMPILRPFLEISKEEISKYLILNALQPLDDPTNRDTKYLRAKTSYEIIPFLTEMFGKNISPSLLRLGKYGEELSSYLEERTKNVLSSEGPFGKMWDFSTSHPLEIRYVLKRDLIPHGIILTEPVLEKILGGIKTRVANLHVGISQEKFVVDRGLFFWVKRELPQFPSIKHLLEKKIVEKGWEWTISFSKSPASTQGWHSWWQGEASLPIPEGKGELLLPMGKLRKSYNKEKIPAFLRGTLPILMKENSLIGDFLTGKTFFSKDKNFFYATIRISEEK